jgi:hypothetical protein
MGADDGLIESIEARSDVGLTTDPTVVFWREARPVYAEKERHGEILNVPRSVRAGPRGICIFCLFALTVHRGAGSTCSGGRH